MFSSLKLTIFCQLFLVVYIVTLSGISCGDLPPEIEKCHAADTNCIVKAINEVLRRFPKGQPSFGLQALDVINIKDVIVSKSQGDRPISMDLKFNTLTVKGFENAIMERVVGFEKDPYTSKFEAYGRMPALSLSGEYEMDGKMLLLPIKGKGIAHLDFTDIKFSLKVKCDVQERNGKHYMLIRKVKSTFETEGLKVNFENLFGTNQDELGQSINAVINENWRDIWKELQGGINNAVSEVITQLLKGVLVDFPYDDFYKAD